MKYRKKFIICNLLAGLTALMYSCRQEPVLELVNTTSLDFPSASAIEFFQGKIYLFGDDASHLLILTPDYKPLDSLRYWTATSARIPKEIKPDIESCFISNERNHPVLIGLGSMSDTNRWKVIKYDLLKNVLDTSSYFLTKDNSAGIEQLNIEGSAVVNTTAVLANRANLSNPINHLLYIDSLLPVASKKLVLPTRKQVAGISGLYYLKEKDILLFTASEEATASTTEDGAIGESYLGGIENFKAKMKEPEIKSDFFYQLSAVDKRLAGQKIESVCIEKINGNELILHLAADNDNGKSQLFKMRFNWKL